MIRKSHVHEAEGKVCYEARSRHPYTKAGVFHRLSGGTFLVAYMGYTGHWYAFDPETGRELATFTRDFYEAQIAPLRIDDLTPDPSCKP